MNTPDTIIAVLAGAFQNSLPKALESIRSAQAGRGPIPEEWLPFLPDQANLTIVGEPEHRSVQDAFPRASWMFLNHKSESVQVVAQLLQRHSHSNRRVLILGFNTEIFSLAKAPWPGLQVKAQHMFTGGRPGVFTTPAIPVVLPADAVAPPWTFEHLSSLEEALATLTDVLRHKGALSAQSPIRQTQLRPWMGQANSKFFGSAATTNSSGMIATLLMIAALRNIVELAGDPGDYLVWMKIQDEAPATQVASASPAQASSSRITNGDRVVPLQAARAENQQRATFPEERRNRQPERYRSDLFSQRIEKAKMGPFPVVRPKLYSSIDKLVLSKLSLSALVEAAIAEVQASVPVGQPWEAIRNVTQSQLLKAQVVLNEHGEPLPDRWQSGGRIVHRLADDWHVRAEGEILMALFENENVTGSDIANICRSVWGSRNSDAQAAFFLVMEYLTEKAQVVEEDKSGVFRVKRHLPEDKNSMSSKQLLDRTPTPSDDVPTHDEPNSTIQ
jgi:hypothetical protein